MYITGTFLDFEQRLHQLPDSTSDLNNFILEGCAYCPSLTTMNLTYFINKWNKEFRKKGYNTDVLGSNCLGYLYDPNGDIILDANGDPVIPVN